ncbi:conserved exported hypothetical protein [uncultured Paludibacter sp.]|nr:conserved exported hypothetical protein [uncultured Paludibacter sp.]
MKKVQIILLALFITNFIFAQSPKREERASWLTTVWRIDWPITVVTSTGNVAQIQAQKNEMTRILDSLKSCNMNAVYFQVRSRCDAMYKSSYEPWSTDLVGTRGMDPGYDPLTFAIEEAHKRGIELHAWLNPYRYETVKNQWTGLPGDYRTPHPDWILTYADVSILDPGRPEVRKIIKNIIGEIVNNYDVDGIIFDDYFYAYGGTSSTLDAATQSLYKPTDMNLGDWRRDNVNKMISDVYDTIQTIKPFVKFGVSPFGIWTTDTNVAIKEGIALPPGITGGNMYAEIYCDPVAWLKQGTVDYISPQLYWTTTSTGQDYDVLCPWWSDLSNKFNKHFYSSQTLSGLSSSSYAPQMRVKANTGEQISNLAVSGIERIGLQRISGATNVSQDEIGNQINRNRLSDINNAPGSVFFSTDPLYTTTGFTNYLRKYKFTQKALTPAISWKSHADYGLVTGIALNATTLTWNSAGTNVRYSVYAIPNDKINLTGNFNTSLYLLGTSYTNSFVIPNYISTATNTFAVAVLDRYGNEFPPQIMGQSTETSVNVNLISPTNEAQMMLPFDFSWTSDSSVDYYLIEVAEDNLFTKPICSRELSGNSFSTVNLQTLKDGKTYYWRVKTRKPNTVDGVSEIRSFTVHTFALTSPTTGSTGVSLTPDFEWDNVSVTASYTLEISTSLQFSSILYSKNTNITSLTLPQGTLVGGTMYYARVKVTDGSMQAISNIVSFTTQELAVPIPQIIKPTNGENINGTSIEVCWQEQNSKGFRAELSENNTFPPRGTTVKTTDAYTFCATYDNLTLGKTYYIRVFGLTSTGMTDASSIISINMSTPVSSVSADNFKCYIHSDNQGNSDLIIYSDEYYSAKIEIYSLTGVMIWNKQTDLFAGKNSIKIDMINLPKGIYPIKIETKRQRIVLKIRN